ncbi:CG32413, partial [Drosophila busckii]
MLIRSYWRHTHPFYQDEAYFKKTLNTLLRPRSPGTPGHSYVREFLLLELKHLGFVTSRREFIDTIAYTNVVGVMNAEAKRFLLASCHYDSKVLPTGDNYVSATDGGVPCAMLLNMAKSLEPYLRNDFLDRPDIGLVLVFFDGHESMDIEDETNSLNGSRRFTDVETIPLNSIEVAIAINLIGAPDAIYMAHYENTYKLHERLADIEEELRSAGQLSKCHKLFHKLKDYNADIEDDHYSFFAESVPVLHLIPHTFPAVSHTEKDNLKNLHWPTVQNMNAIFTTFVYDYLKK